MGTVIKLTPPGGAQETVGAYESCNVNTSITERAGTFSLVLPFRANEDVSRFVVGTDVEITQNGHVFRGWVMKPPLQRNGAIKTLSLEGSDYTAKTQKIMVTESYTDTEVSDIVDDLFAKYVPWATRVNISSNSRPLTIRFPDVFLWDAMEQICQLCGFDWFIDENLDVNFFEVANTINSNVINEKSYKAGSASFDKDSSKLVNKLWVKGAKALSLPYEQAISVSGNTPIPLFYKPRAKDTGIIVEIGGVQKTLGIQYLDTAGTKDFLLNYQEKLLIPDLVTTGTGTVTYSYEYPVKILLENEESKAIYGLFEDVLVVDFDDKDIAREIGNRYLDKYSKPVTVGSIDPISGIYHCGELVKVEISSFGINEYLVVKSVSYESVRGEGKVNIKLTLENTQKDLGDIIKTMEKRLRKLESALFGQEDATVEQYKTFKDVVASPQLQDNGLTYTLHDYLVCGPNIIGGVFRI